MHRVQAVGKVFGFRVTVLVANERVLFGCFRAVVITGGFEINLEFRAFFGCFNSGAAVVGVLDDGNIALGGGFLDFHVDGVLCQGEEFRVGTDVVNGLIERIADRRRDFA